MEIQIFGHRKSADTRAALRFFAERRVKVHFVDFDVRGPSTGELKRFAERFGVEALVDRESRNFTARGLGAARYGPERWLALLVEDPLLLRVPLVRWQGRLTVGRDEAAWRDWHAAGRDSRA